MIALIILPILISGYIWIKNHPKESLKISKLQGWLIYLESAKCGFFIFLATAAAFEVLVPRVFSYIALLFSSIPCLNLAHIEPINFNVINFLSSQITDLLHDPKLSKANDSLNLSSKIMSLGVFSVLSSFMLVKAIKSYTKDRQMLYIKDVIQSDAPIEHLLFSITEKFMDEMRDEKIDSRELNYALISLENNKFYIGLSTTIPVPDEKNIYKSEIDILPFYSGYRDKDTQRMIITNRYLFDFENSTKIDLISISRDKIISVSAFSEKTHEAVDNNMQK